MKEDHLIHLSKGMELEQSGAKLINGKGEAGETTQRNGSKELEK